MQSGHSFQVIASQISYLTGRGLKLARLIKQVYRNGMKVIRIGNRFGLHKSFILRVLNFFYFSQKAVRVALKLPAPDVVWGTTPPIFQAVSALIVAKIKGSRFLLEVRDLWPEFAIDMGVLNHPLLQRLSKWLARFLYHCADRIIVNSPAYHRHLISLGVAAAKIEFIPNGVDMQGFLEVNTNGEFRRQHGLADKFIALYAGAIGPANGLDTVLKAAKLLQDTDIVLALVGDGKDRVRLEQMARQAQLDNVRFIPPCAKDAIPAVLASADVCFATLQNIPMFRMTYPNKVFDYMAAGKATVLAIDGVIREVIESADGGMFVPPGDANAFAGALRYYRDHPDQARDQGGRPGVMCASTLIEGCRRKSWRRCCWLCVMSRAWWVASSVLGVVSRTKSEG